LRSTGSITDRVDELGMEATPVLGRLDRRDDRDVAEARGLGEEGDALEQAVLRCVLDTGQEVGLHIDDHEHGVVGIDQVAHARKASGRRRVPPWL
jgi:hypothetical protein